MRKLISFCLYGNKELYLRGAIENLKLQPVIYPGWSCRYYIDNTVPADIATQLRQGAEVIEMPHEEGKWAMFWRHLPFLDADVDAFICRDVDSRLSVREADAVQQWLESGKSFHIMRDNPAHNIPIMGGMFGSLHIPRIQKMYTSSLATFKALPNTGKDFGADQEFLTARIWPIIRNNHMAHVNRKFSNLIFTGQELDFRVNNPDGAYVGQMH